MIRGLLLWVCLSSAAAADDDTFETFTGQKERPRVEAVPEPVLPALPAAAGDYAPAVVAGAQALATDPAFVHDVRLGLDRLFRRDYDGARAHFEAVERRWPDSGVAAVAETLVWQALMFENFDFRHEKAWKAASERARKGLTAALDRPGNEGWEHFMLAGIVGIESIHTMRREQYLSALQLAFEAMDHAERARAAAKDFVDLLLADGIYNYWRTVVTMSSRVLPDFGDHRAEGLQQMQTVEAAGVFLAAPATLSLAYSWLEERDTRRALASCKKNHDAYPNNVVNNLLLGRVYVADNKFDSALRVYDAILTAAPDNRRVHYYRALALMRAGRIDDAKAALGRYLATEYLESWQRSAALYRLGQIAYRQKRYDDAEVHWQQAIRIDGNKPAKQRLEHLRELSRKGQLP